MVLSLKGLKKYDMIVMSYEVEVASGTYYGKMTRSATGL